MISRTVTRTSRSFDRGFTLVELMIAIVLSLFLIGAVLLTYLSSRAAALDAERLSRTQENVRIVSEYLVREIRNAGFRDEASLILGHETRIREQFAYILDEPLGKDEPPSGTESLNTGPVLRVRFAGRGHCGEAFEEVRIVQNEYFLDGEVLRCNGSAVLGDADPDANFEEPDDVRARGVALISGVTNITFSKVCDASGLPCTGCRFELPTPSPSNEDYFVPLAQTCVGVRLDMEFEGGREVAFVSAFRNAILEKIRRGVPPA